MRYACDGRSLESTPEFERRKVMGVNCRLELQRARAVDARREWRIVIERSPRVVVPAYEGALWLAHKACRTGYDNIGLLTSVKTSLQPSEYGLRCNRASGIHGVGVRLNRCVVRGLLDPNAREGLI